jgi:prepilin-type N-terminal cleavage/methylation domain-containing protein
MRKAFTLVELTVVLSVIGILFAILFPVFKGARDRAARQSHGYGTPAAAQAVVEIETNSFMIDGEYIPFANVVCIKYLPNDTVDVVVPDTVRSDYQRTITIPSKYAREFRDAYVDYLTRTPVGGSR